MWNNKELLSEAVSKSNSRNETLVFLGYNPKASSSRNKLSEAIVRFKLDISHFRSRPERWDVLKGDISDCFSFADILKKVGLSDKGSNHLTAKKYIQKHNLNTSHFIKGGSSPSLTFEEVFCENSAVSKSSLRCWTIKHSVLDFDHCSQCKNKYWLNEILPLQIDHKNGISNDNRVENLRILCPNCHSLTPTFGARKR